MKLQLIQLAQDQAVQVGAGVAIAAAIALSQKARHVAGIAIGVAISNGIKLIRFLSKKEAEKIEEEVVAPMLDDIKTGMLRDNDSTAQEAQNLEDTVVEKSPALQAAEQASKEIG